MSFTDRGLGIVLLALPALPFLTGCATFMNGTTQRIPIATDPPGALVEVDGKTYQTPCTLKLERKCDHVVAISMPGYRTEIRNVVRQPTRAILGNIWIGGLIGLGVDAASGANNKLVPECFDLKLARLEAKPEEESVGVSASVLDHR